MKDPTLLEVLKNMKHYNAGGRYHFCHEFTMVYRKMTNQIPAYSMEERYNMMNRYPKFKNWIIYHGRRLNKLSNSIYKFVHTPEETSAWTNINPEDKWILLQKLIKRIEKEEGDDKD